MSAATDRPRIRRVRCLSWIAVGALGVYFALRLHDGCRPDFRELPERVLWDLQVLRHHGGAGQAFGILAVLAGLGAVFHSAFRFLRAESPVSPGAVLFLALGFADALGGGAIHLAGPVRAEFWPASLLVVRSLALTAALPALFLTLTRPGLSLLLPSLSLTALGFLLWLTPFGAPETAPEWTSRWYSPSVQTYSRLHWFRQDEIAPSDGARGLRTARLEIASRLLASGDDGVRALLYAPEDCSTGLLHRFGAEAIPLLRQGLGYSWSVVRCRAIDALVPHAKDPAIARDVAPLLSDPNVQVARSALVFFAGAEGDRKGTSEAARVPESVEPLKRLLRHSWQNVREMAVRALRQQDPTAGLRDLGNLLRFEPESSVSEEAARSLLLAPGSQGLSILLDVAGGGAAGFSIPDKLSLDATHVPTLLDSIGSSSDDLAQAMLRSTLFDEVLASEALLDRLLALAKSRNQELRLTVLLVLSKVDHPRAHQACEQALGTEDETAVLDGLRRRGLLRGKEFLEAIRRVGVDAFVMFRAGPEDRDLVAPLEEAVSDPGTPSNVVLQSLWQLSRIDPDRAVQLAVRFHDADFPAISERSLFGFLPADRVAPLLQSADARIRLEAYTRLAALGDPALECLLAEGIRSEPLQNHAQSLFRIAARLGLRDTAPAILERLMPTLADLDPKRVYPAFQLEALATLGDLADPRSVPELRKARRLFIDRNYGQLYQHATLALGFSGDREVLPALADLLRWPAYRNCQDCPMSPTCAPARALASLGEPGVDVLLDVLSEEPWDGALAEALGRSKSARGKEPLLALLSGRRETERRSAAMGLGHLEDPDTTAALRSALSDPSPRVVEAVRWALQQVSGIDAGIRMSPHSRHEFVAPPRPARYLGISPRQRQEFLKARNAALAARRSAAGVR